MTAILAEGFLLGLAMGGYCAASCAPFVVPYLLSTGPDTLGPRLGVFGRFLLGRLIAYALVAVAAALAGSALAVPVAAPVRGGLMMAASAVLIGFSIWNARRGLCFCPGKRGNGLASAAPLLTGLLLGFNLCPPFAIAVLRGLEMGEVPAALSYFGALFAGTTVFLLPAPFVSWWLASAAARRMGAYLGVLAGAWFLIQGAVLAG